MKQTLLITGATGFLGSSLLKQFPWDNYEKVVLAVRDIKKITVPLPDNVVLLTGSLNDESYCSQITENADTVLHMASATGKLKAEEYRKAVTEVTSRLVEASEQSGVKHFVYISTIAVNFTKAPRYFYAQAKKEAEKAVAASSLRTSIVRPTMIFGTGSPVFNGFKMLASLPIIPMFGAGDIRIQPIDVDDAASALIDLIASSPEKDSIIELGGREELTVKELMTSIARENGKAKPAFFPIPISLVSGSLRVTEPLLYSLLPFTLGQLASFRNHSTTNKKNPISDSSTSIKEMILKSMQQAPPSREELLKECNTYCRYLTGKAPDQYLTDKYIDYHRKLKPEGVSAFDGLVNKIASINPLMTKACDAWCRFFLPTSLLRHKLTYLLGIAETVPPYSDILDSSDNMSTVVLFLRLGIRGVLMVMQICLASIFLIPGKILLHKTKEDKK